MFSSFRRTLFFPVCCSFRRMSSPPADVDDVTESLKTLSVSTPDPLSVYVPWNALTKKSVQSVVKVIAQSDRWYPNQSSDTLLAFLLALNKKLTTSEETDERAKEIREWLEINGNPPDWKRLEEKFDHLLEERERKQFDSPYHELVVGPVSLLSDQ